MEWQVELETHTHPGSLTVYVHYGQSRTKDAKFLAQNDVVLTTYGVLASEYSAEVIVVDLLEIDFFWHVLQIYISNNYIICL